METAEYRGIYPSKKAFQVSADTSELKPAKIRKCDTCHRWDI
jgi:hypothetical protein